MPRRAIAAGLISAVALAGCGATHRQEPHHAAVRARPSPIAQAQATHEYPSPPGKRQTAGGHAPTPVQAIRTFATAYINWSARTVTGDMRRLAAASVGQARAAMTLAAAGTAGDYELRRGGVANAGTVEAIAPLASQKHQYVVVTLESTSATATDAYQGLEPAWHLALATVLELPAGRWVLSGWQPEN